MVTAQGLFVLLLLPALIFVTTWFFDSLGEGGRYEIDLARVDLRVPDDITGADQLRHELRALTEGQGSLSILGNDLDVALRQMLKSNPYVRDIRKVRRRFPGRVEVGLDFRQPVAALHVRGRHVLVDQMGDLLPLLDDVEVAELPLVTVYPEDREGPATGDFEEAWLLAAVKEGIQVLKDLLAFADDRVFNEVYIAAVDVSNFGGRLDPNRAEVSLVTDRSWFDSQSGRQRPTMLLWGRSTAHPLHLLELPVANKIQHLRNVLKARPSGLANLQSVDLRFDKVYFREN